MLVRWDSFRQLRKLRRAQNRVANKSLTKSPVAELADSS